MSEYKSILVLTGAGISAESGLLTFRDNGGLWENQRIEDVATPEAFARNPELVQGFYNARRAQLQASDVQPNPAHKALALFEQSFKGDFTIVTQNVDNLHEKAGSQSLLHMHGELNSALCQHCGATQSWTDDIEAHSQCHQCQSTGNLRPDIVWFGEMPKYMDAIEEKLMACDLFISIGTSGEVYPAAGFQRAAQQYGAKTVELNLEPSAGYSYFDEQHYGPASKVVPDYMAGLAG